MIIKNYELQKLKLINSNIYLLYGTNEGLKEEVIKAYFTKDFDGKIQKYEEIEILNNYENFISNLLNKSFFDNKKMIIITRPTDKILNLINELIEKKILDVKIIINSNILEKKSKLRSFFEKEKNIICVPFYSDTNEIMSNLSLNFFKKKKISISQETINLIIERCRGNRENLYNELEKIENYSRNKKIVNYEEILKITNLAENYNISELTDNCLAKNTKKTSHILNENNFSDNDCILIVRTLLIKAKRILKLQQEINNNSNIEQVIKNFKPPIFWKDKEIVKAQIKNWPLKKIQSVIIKINEIELLIKKNSLNSLNILSDFIISQANKSNN